MSVYITYVSTSVCVVEVKSKQRAEVKELTRLNNWHRESKQVADRDRRQI